jgi:hypothetical protein
MILGSEIQRKVGEMGNRIEINGVEYKQPFVCLREATRQEYLDCCKDLGSDENPLNKFYYKVSTD